MLQFEAMDCLDVGSWLSCFGFIVSKPPIRRINGRFNCLFGNSIKCIAISSHWQIKYSNHHQQTYIPSQSTIFWMFVKDYWCVLFPYSIRNALTWLFVRIFHFTFHNKKIMVIHGWNITIISNQPIKHWLRMFWMLKWFKNDWMCNKIKQIAQGYPLCVAIVFFIVNDSNRSCIVQYAWEK